MKTPPNSKILDFLRRKFPSWRGRKARMQVSDHPRTLSSFWDGGSMDTWWVFDLQTGADVHVQVWSNPFASRPADYMPVSGQVLVRHSIICGKDAGYCLFVHPDDKTRFE